MSNEPTDDDAPTPLIDPSATIQSAALNDDWAREAAKYAAAVTKAEYGADGDWRAKVKPEDKADLFSRVWDESTGSWKSEAAPVEIADPSLVDVDDSLSDGAPISDAERALAQSLEAGPSFSFPPADDHDTGAPTPVPAPTPARSAAAGPTAPSGAADGPSPVTSNRAAMISAAAIVTVGLAFLLLAAGAWLLRG